MPAWRERYRPLPRWLQVVLVAAVLAAMMWAGWP